MIALLAMGDALPPAAMALFTEFGPISSMNWTVNMLTGTPRTDDGWWLLSARTGYARAGFSVQDMMIWNRAGEPVMSGSQGIAIYARSEEHTSELQSLMRISYAVFYLKKKKHIYLATV